MNLTRPSLLATFLTLIAIGAGQGCSDPASGGGGDTDLTVVERPLRSTITVVGKIAPETRVEVLAPFAGPVRSVAFEYGRKVRAGDVLLTMDPAEMRLRRRAAESAFLKARQGHSDLVGWETGPEVAQARMDLQRAERELAAARREAVESRRLFDRGIVARDELDETDARVVGLQASVAMARRTLASTLARGQGAPLQAQRLELANAAEVLAAIDRELAGAVVRAPAPGVFTRPLFQPGAEPIHAGAVLTRGQQIGSIAAGGGFAVLAQVSEADASRISDGQAVQVTGPAFKGLVLDGVVASIAGEAAPSETADNAQFPMRAVIDQASPALAQTLRIGMTADVTITLVEKPRAILLPAAAIRGSSPDAFVLVRSAKGRSTRTPVRLGESTPEGVEVIAGLRPGQKVILPAATADESR